VQLFNAGLAEILLRVPQEHIEWYQTKHHHQRYKLKLSLFIDFLLESEVKVFRFGLQGDVSVGPEPDDRLAFLELGHLHAGLRSDLVEHLLGLGDRLLTQLDALQRVLFLLLRFF
jgi:hypothetical protein